MGQIKTAVSLYSYQDEYVRGKMTLEDCIKELHELQVNGVELLPDQMLHKAPFVADKDIKKWHAILGKYNIVPVCNDIFINTKLYNNRILTHDENLEFLKNELRLAHKLGMRLVRLVSMTPTDIIADALPLAEELNVAMALEVHAAMSFDIPQTKAFTDIMFKLDSPYVGLVIDTGIFCRRFPRVAKEYFLQQGLTKELAEYIDKIYLEHECITSFTITETMPADLKRLIKSDVDELYVVLADGYENRPFNILDKYYPYIKHFHGKAYEMTEAGVEYSIDYKGLIDYLKHKNYDGYIATEYEGGRFALPGVNVDAVSQVRAQQKMFREYIS